MTMRNVNKAEKMDSTYLSSEELEVAVSMLNAADILRLKKIANQYTGNHELDANDLVQEAVLRTLSGGRKTCPKNLPIVNFLAGVMKSIAHGEREKNDRTRDTCDIALCQVHDPNSNPENDVLERQLFKKLEVIFEDDEEILLLILYLQEGSTSSEIQENEGWSRTQFNTIRRRMRRKWNSYTKQEKLS